MDYYSFLRSKQAFSRPISLTILFVLLTLAAAASNINEVKAKVDRIEGYVNTGKLDSARIVLDELEHTILSSEDSDILSRYHFSLGIYLTQKEQLDSALVHLHLAKDLALGITNTDSVHLAKVYGNLFAPLEITGKREIALEYISKAVEIADKIGPEKIKDTGQYYRKFAFSKLMSGDTDQATYYLKKSEQFYLNHDSNNTRDIITVGSTLAFTMLQMGQVEEASHKYKELISYSKQQELPEHTNLTMYIGLAIAHRESKNYKEALETISIAEEVALKFLGPQHRAMGDIYNVKGNILLELEEFDKAYNFVQKALQNRESIAGTKSYYSTEEYWTLGEIRLKQEQYDEAIPYFESALNSLEYKFNDPSYFSGKRNYTAIINSLTFSNRGYIEKYLKYNESEDLNSALALAHESVFALEQMRLNFNTMGSKEFIVNQAYSIYENGIHAKYLEYASTQNQEVLYQALDYMERSKMQSLLESARESGYNYEDKIPEEIISQRNAIRSELEETKELIDSNEEQDPKLEKQYLALTEKLQDVIKTIRSEYPQHSNFTEQVEELDMSSVQNQIINDSTAVIEYFLGDEYLFRICISKQGIDLDKQVLPKDFENHIETFRLHIDDYDQPATEESVNILSKLLLSDLSCLANSKTRHLKIIPDEFLWHIPFEMLVNKESENMLIEEYTVSYGNSLKLLLHQNNMSHSANGKILAFVPEYSESNTQVTASIERSEIGSLYGAKKEVQEILELLPGESFTGQTAVKSNFIDAANNFEVLHLAMHTKPDAKNNASLLFDKNGGIDYEKLSFAELSSLEIKSNLAVISACKSGIGRIKRGAGIESLSQAFTYAGVPATVMSLWNAPDESTSKIMINFYKQLSLGLNKADALRIAKLEYLADDSVPTSQKKYKHWAGFIVEGNLDAIQFAGSGMSKNILYFLMGIFAFGFIVFLDKRKKI